MVTTDKAFQKHNESFSMQKMKLVEDASAPIWKDFSSLRLTCTQIVRIDF